jgi:hypothetical protein
VVESTGLENQQGFIALLEFKSLSHRQIKKNPLIERLAGFLLSGTEEIHVKDKQGFIALNLRVEFKFTLTAKLRKTR